MGNVQSIDIPQTCVPIGPPESDDESPIYHNSHMFAENGGKFIATFRSQPESRTIIDILKTSAVKYANLDCSGEREILPDKSAGPYRYISYKEFYDQCIAFGRGLLEIGLSKGDKVGIYSSNSRWWQTIAFGAYSVGMTIVPVYDSLGKDAAQYIINHAEVKAVFTSVFKYRNTVAYYPEFQGVEHVVVMGDEVPDEPAAPCEVLTCRGILELGKKSDKPLNFPQPEDVAVIMYTSGSTGKPKGCLLQHQNVVAGAAGLGNINMSITSSDTYLSFLPLAHIYAMAVELVGYAQGVRIAYARGPVKDLIDDIQAMKPTAITSVPRILNRIADAMKQQIAAKPWYIQKLLWAAINAKADALAKNAPNSLILDGILFAKFRAALGGRVRCLINGGAPIIDDVFRFLSATVTPNIIQGYGLTEVAAGLAVQEIPAPSPRTVGPSSIACEVKLRRVPGADYNPNDPVAPTGELLVRGPIVFAGYYKQPELTEEAMPGGWFATGDVCKITRALGHIEIIDRAKQLVKLSQGEYLSLTQLTECYSMADLVSFIYVYADSRHNEPLAVVIPKASKISEWEGQGKDVKNDPSVKEELVASLHKIYEEYKLRGFERITHIVVDTQEPTVENGLLTPSMKPQFASLKAKYGEQLNALYESIEPTPTLEKSSEV